MTDYKKLLDDVEDMILDGKANSSLFEVREALKELAKEEEMASFTKGDILLVDGEAIILLKPIANGRGWIVYQTVKKDVALMTPYGFLKYAKKVGYMEPKIIVREVKDEKTDV